MFLLYFEYTLTTSLPLHTHNPPSSKKQRDRHGVVALNYARQIRAQSLFCTGSGCRQGNGIGGGGAEEVFVVDFWQNETRTCAQLYWRNVALHGHDFVRGADDWFPDWWRGFLCACVLYVCVCACMLMHMCNVHVYTYVCIYRAIWSVSQCMRVCI